MNVPRSVWESTERGFEVDLTMIMRITGSSAHPERASASAILGWFKKKGEWNLGTEQSLYAKFHPEHHRVSTLHQAMILRGARQQHRRDPARLGGREQGAGDRADAPLPALLAALLA